MKTTEVERFVLTFCIFASIAGLLLLVLAWIVGSSHPRARVITPHAVYENAEVLQEGASTGVVIVTEDGQRITIRGCATIVWNAEEEP